MTSNNKVIYIETYGCTANQNNSEILAGILSRAGFIITNNPELSEIIIINSCVVKSKTESKIKRRIQDIQKEHKNKQIIVTGCMPQTDFKKLKNLAPNILFLGTHNFKDILNLIRDYSENKLTKEKQIYYISQNPEIKLNLSKKPQNPLISIHQISEGCLGECTYCKTRLAKGKLFSYTEEEILKSIESDFQSGAKEVWITSQDNAAYGLDWANSRETPSKKPLGVLDKDNAAYGIDKGKQQLPQLLNEILNLKHNFKLRLGMADPNNIIPIQDELIEIYKNKKMFKFIHLPIQSASNKILKDMNRFYTIDQAENIITKFKTAFPEGVIATDIIVGYPTETEEDHKKNLEFIKKYKPDVLNISKFSSHKSTPAGKLKILPNSILKKRATELMQIHRETAKQNKQKFLNKTLKVFINKKMTDNLYQARDENYNIIYLKADKTLLGKEVEVKITSIGVHNLVGELVNN